MQHKSQVKTHGGLRTSFFFSYYWYINNNSNHNHIKNIIIIIIIIIKYTSCKFLKIKYTLKLPSKNIVTKNNSISIRLPVHKKVQNLSLTLHYDKIVSFFFFFFFFFNNNYWNRYSDDEQLIGHKRMFYIIR